MTLKLPHHPGRAFGGKSHTIYFSTHTTPLTLDPLNHTHTMTSSDSSSDSDLDRSVFSRTAASKNGYTFDEFFAIGDTSPQDGYLDPDLPPPTPQAKKEPTSPPPVRVKKQDRPKPVIMSADRDILTVETTVTVKTPPRSPPDAPKKPRSDIAMRRDRLLRLQNNLDDMRNDNRDKQYASKAVGEFDMDGNLLRTFETQEAAARAAGIDRGLMSRKIRGVNWKGEPVGSPRIHTYSSGQQVRFRNIAKGITVSTDNNKKKRLKRTPSSSPFTDKSVDDTVNQGDLTPRAHSNRPTRKPEHLMNESPKPQLKRKRNVELVYAKLCDEGLTCFGHRKGQALFLTTVHCSCDCLTTRAYCLHCIAKAQTKMRKPRPECHFCRSAITNMKVEPVKFERPTLPGSDTE